MNGMKDLLAEIAAEAMPYDVTDRAIRTARRQRRTVWAASLAVATLVAVGLFAALPLRSPGPDGPTVASVAWLPRHLAPVGSTPRLPSGPVAPAVLAYTQNSGATTLLTEDGQRYALDGAVRAISPDGRWLAVTRGETLTLRDLNGTANRTLGDGIRTDVAAWSADGRWLALRTGGADPVSQRTAVVDLASGREAGTVPAGRYGRAYVCGLRDTPELVLCAGEDASPRFDLWVIDGTTGHQLRHETVDPSAVLTDSERKADWVVRPGLPDNTGRLLPDGRTLVVRTFDYRADEGVTIPDDMLAADLDQPEEQPRRYAIPDPTLGKAHPNPDGSTTNYDTGEFRHGLAGVDGGIVMAHLVPSGRAERVAGLEMLDTSSGTLAEITTVSGDIRAVVVRGQATG